MLIRKPRTTRMKLTIDLSAEAATLLEMIRKRAKADGADVDLAGAVVGFLERKIRAVVKQMDAVSAELRTDPLSGDDDAGA